LIDKDASGIFNVGTDLKSIYELSKLTNENIIPILKPIGVPSNVSMNINKLNNYFKK